MSEVSGVPNDEAIGRGSRNMAALGAVDWLGLAATPTFAIMALLTGVLGGERMVMTYGTAPSPSAICGMVPMYLLMSGFHFAPWLRFIASRRSSSVRLYEGSASPSVPRGAGIPTNPSVDLAGVRSLARG